MDGFSVINLLQQVRRRRSHSSQGQGSRPARPRSTSVKGPTLCQGQKFLLTVPLVYRERSVGGRRSTKLTDPKLSANFFWRRRQKSLLRNSNCSKLRANNFYAAIVAANVEAMSKAEFPLVGRLVTSVVTTSTKGQASSVVNKM